MYTNLRNAAQAYAHAGSGAGAPPTAQSAPPQVPGGTGFANPKSTVSAYANVGLETGVVAASPHRLIVMLYEGAELAVRMAIKHMNEGDIARKSATVTKASSIIQEGLRSALDLQQGGAIAEQLDALYEYMNQRLMLGHLRNQTAPLEEVLGLLQELHGAWKQIGQTAGPATPTPATSTHAAA